MNTLDTVRATIHQIETHLTTRRLNLDAVAHAVGYSKFHLHRLFTTTVGLSIHDYVRRRLLTEAARQLVCSDKPVIEIGLLAGYGSQQAFTDAFRTMYKRPPHQFRVQRRFYPLQLPYGFDDSPGIVGDSPHGATTRIAAASTADIPAWMNLVRLVVDGFPGLDEQEHMNALRHHIGNGSAMLLTRRGMPVGALVVDRQSAHIGMLAVHPLYRQQGITRDLLRLGLSGMTDTRPVTTTTFRAGDKADTGHRLTLLKLGFCEGATLTEFGYPTQRMVLPPGCLHE